jgi:hypothetical protein
MEGMAMNKQAYMDDALFARECGEYAGLVVDDLTSIPKGFKGEVMEINDHGNVTLYKAFKNGSLHEIVSRV